MGSLGDLFRPSTTGAASSFIAAVNVYKMLDRPALNDDERADTLARVVSLCCDAIQIDERAGDAYILLADALGRCARRSEHGLNAATFLFLGLTAMREWGDLPRHVSRNHAVADQVKAILADQVDSASYGQLGELMMEGWGDPSGFRDLVVSHDVAEIKSTVLSREGTADDLTEAAMALARSGKDVEARALLRAARAALGSPPSRAGPSRIWWLLVTTGFGMCTRVSDPLPDGTPGAIRWAEIKESVDCLRLAMETICPMDSIWGVGVAAIPPSWPDEIFAAIASAPGTALPAFMDEELAILSDASNALATLLSIRWSRGIEQNVFNDGAIERVLGLGYLASKAASKIDDEQRRSKYLDGALSRFSAALVSAVNRVGPRIVHLRNKTAEDHWTKVVQLALDELLPPLAIRGHRELQAAEAFDARGALVAGRAAFAAYGPRLWDDPSSYGLEFSISG